MTLRFQQAGAGVPVVMMHPFPLSARAYRLQLEHPPAGVHFIAPDFAGFGDSAALPARTSMDAMADDVLALMDSLKLDSAYVGGVSMGGYVALALTRLNPGRVRGLVLADTQSLADDAAGRERRETTARDLEQKGMQVLIDGLLPKLFGPSASPALRAEVEGLFRATSAPAAAAATRAMATRTDGKDILSRFGGPVLVVVGQHDVVTPVEKAQVMVNLATNARLEVIDDAGHLSQMEQPGAFTAALERFLTP